MILLYFTKLYVVSFFRNASFTHLRETNALSTARCLRCCQQLLNHVKEVCIEVDLSAVAMLRQVQRSIKIDNWYLFPFTGRQSVKNSAATKSHVATKQKENISQVWQFFCPWSTRLRTKHYTAIHFHVSHVSLNHAATEFQISCFEDRWCIYTQGMVRYRTSLESMFIFREKMTFYLAASSNNSLHLMGGIYYQKNIVTICESYHLQIST